MASFIGPAIALGTALLAPKGGPTTSPLEKLMFRVHAARLAKFGPSFMRAIQQAVAQSPVVFDQEQSNARARSTKQINAEGGVDNLETAATNMNADIAQWDKMPQEAMKRMGFLQQMLNPKGAQQLGAAMSARNSAKNAETANMWASAGNALANLPWDKIFKG